MDRTKADWSKQTLMDWVFESRQTLRFILWDYDGKGSASHDYIGEATLDLGSIIGARGSTVTVALTRDPARGRAFVFPPSKPVTLTIRAAEVRGSMNDVFRFQPRGAGLDRKDFFGSRLVAAITAWAHSVLFGSPASRTAQQLPHAEHSVASTITVGSAPHCILSSCLAAATPTWCCCACSPTGRA